MGLFFPNDFVDWLPNPPCSHYVKHCKCSTRPRRCFGLRMAKCVRDKNMAVQCELEEHPYRESDKTNDAVQKLKKTIEESDPFYRNVMDATGPTNYFDIGVTGKRKIDYFNVRMWD